MNGLADFFMVRSALDGVSNMSNSPPSYKIMNVLWADDGSGALVAEQPQGTRPMCRYNGCRLRTRQPPNYPFACQYSPMN